MAIIQIVTPITAPIGRCFDLARDIDFHTRSMAHTGERAVAGRTCGLIGLGESVTWEARHLGVQQRLTSRITAFDRPVYFRDEMTAGAFRSFEHDHRFEEVGGETIMVDEVERTILNLINEDSRSPKHARGNWRKGATSLSLSAQDTCQATKKDELSNIQDLESSQDHCKLGINCSPKVVSP